METKYLIDWLQDWADEFDLAGFEVVSEEQLNTLIEGLKNCDNWDEDYEFYFGTNECQYFTKEEILDILDEARPLSQAEYDVINHIFGKKYGIVFYDDICQRIEELKLEKQNV